MRVLAINTYAGLEVPLIEVDAVANLVESVVDEVIKPATSASYGRPQ
ncbi:hypothetical protein IL992_37905 [Microbispora sp. NEAU-D428]|nr:hypothetical protein [Microbispora sitophila]MBE3014906.1 hypothetical protein [Microbispora sitophila]